MSIISAGTTTTTALVQTGDTNGNLVLQTGSTPTTAMTISSSQIVNFANAPTVGGAPLPSGAFNLISTQTANNTSQYLTFTNIGTYKQYILFYNNISNNGGNNNYLQFATGSTPTWQTSGYVWQLNVAYNSTQALNRSTSSSGVIIGFNGTDSSFGFSGTSVFSELSNPSLYQTVYSSVAYVGSNYMTNTTSAGNYQGSSAAITGIRIDGGGTIVSGSASLYGLSS